MWIRQKKGLPREQVMFLKFRTKIFPIVLTRLDEMDVWDDQITKVIHVTVCTMNEDVLATLIRFPNYFQNKALRSTLGIYD